MNRTTLTIVPANFTRKRRIKELERENEELRSTVPYDLSRFGAQAGNDDVNLTANVSLKVLDILWLKV